MLDEKDSSSQTEQFLEFIQEVSALRFNFSYSLTTVMFYKGFFNGWASTS